jgi:glycosyltransferase involved in cell wall biosynthesis
MLRVTFVTPHRRRTSGGVYAIERFASGATERMRARLAVRKGAPGVLPGVDVLPMQAPDFTDLPNADILMVPADSQDGAALYALPASKGRPVLLFQGYGTPHNPVVTANLDRADLVVAVAGWLVEEAKRHGCRAEHVRYGLDRSIFVPGPPAGRRAPVVAMLTHHVPWKGTADGVSALETVRRALPETQVRLFGVSSPATDLTFVPSPTRAEVAGLLGRAAVFVCASWEEGFGMPGLEALACGAALATTDTKGSRDYALHGQTALVSPPRDVEMLAAHVLELLREREDRDRLAQAGREYATAHFESWDQAATRFAQVLMALV